MNENTASQPSRRILIVEDESVVRDLLNRILPRPEYRLTFAVTVAEGIQWIQEGIFDLLLSDLRLPDGSGVEVIRPFRDRFPQAPILVVTGSLTPEERLAQVGSLGIQACIQKPFKVRELQRTVEQALTMVSHA
jgi:two-component system response regulator PilR (NtrC family)